MNKSQQLKLAELKLAKLKLAELKLRVDNLELLVQITNSLIDTISSTEKNNS